MIAAPLYAVPLFKFPDESSTSPVTPPFLEAQRKLRELNMWHRNIEEVELTIVEFTALTDALYDNQTIGDL